MSKCLKFSALISIIGAALFLYGCGPVYQTNYSYKLPNSSRGRQCINQCLWRQNTCSSRCQRNFNNCQSNAEYFASKQKRECYKHHGKHCDWINANDNNCQRTCGCDGMYRTCYSNCGGQVIPHTQCVMFCKSAQPTYAVSPASAGRQ